MRFCHFHSPLSIPASPIASQSRRLKVSFRSLQRKNSTKPPLSRRPTVHWSLRFRCAQHSYRSTTTTTHPRPAELFVTVTPSFPRNTFSPATVALARCPSTLRLAHRFSLASVRVVVSSFASLVVCSSIMEIISYEYTKQRREFGLHPQFGDSAPKLESVQANDEEAKQWLTSGQDQSSGQGEGCEWAGTHDPSCSAPMLQSGQRAIATGDTRSSLSFAFAALCMLRACPPLFVFSSPDDCGARLHSRAGAA